MRVSCVKLGASVTIIEQTKKMPANTTSTAIHGCLSSAVEAYERMSPRSDAGSFRISR